MEVTPDGSRLWRPWGSGGRGFKSPLPDQIDPAHLIRGVEIGTGDTPKVRTPDVFSVRASN